MPYDDDVIEICIGPGECLHSFIYIAHYIWYRTLEQQLRINNVYRLLGIYI